MDSNVLIDYASGKFSGAAELKLDGIFNESFHYSILSRMEVLGYNARPYAPYPQYFRF